MTRISLQVRFFFSFFSTLQIDGNKLLWNVFSGFKCGTMRGISISLSNIFNVASPFYVTYNAFDGVFLIGDIINIALIFLRGVQYSQRRICDLRHGLRSAFVLRERVDSRCLIRMILGCGRKGQSRHDHLFGHGRCVCIAISIDGVS